jgi:uncharacterized protein YndB with AHSA1/START domain
MNATNFTTSLTVNQSVKEVFSAITNVQGWWQGEISGSSNKLNDEFDYRMHELHYSKQKVVEFIPNQKLVWRVTESRLSFVANQEEWTDTTIVFEITARNNKTHLQFTHMGLVPSIACYGDCSNGWEQLIQQSLYSLITTGKGKTVFNF